MEKSPNKTIKISYHTPVDAPNDDDTTRQKMKMDHKMVWTAAQGAPVKKAGQTDGETSEMDYKHIATAASAKTWESTYCTVAWSCTWHDLGLTPVRPQVVLKKPLTLHAGQCLQIAG